MKPMVEARIRKRMDDTCTPTWALRRSERNQEKILQRNFIMKITFEKNNNLLIQYGLKVIFRVEKLS